MTGITETLMNATINLINNMGYMGIFIGMSVNMMGIELPSEVIMPLAGFAAYQGKMSLWGITLVASAAEVLGALVIYFIALKGGRPLLDKYGKYVLLPPSKLDRADKWFGKYGHEAVLMGRCIPIVRKLITVPAGIARMNLKKFIIYTFRGSLPYAFALGYMGFILGPNWNIIESYSTIYDVIIYAGIVLIIAYIAYKIFRTSTETSQTHTKPKLQK